MDYHLGTSIKERLRQQNRTVVWFSRRLCCTRANVYAIFRKSALDTELLARVCRVLGHDFFEELSRHYCSGLGVDDVDAESPTV